MFSRSSSLLGVLLALVAAIAAGCEGPAGPTGRDGTDGDGDDGEDGDDGADGDDGEDGDDGVGTWLAGPGLAIDITAAAIDAAGVATVELTVSDSAGVPLDVTGILSEGAVSASFMLAWLDEGPGGEALQYTSYVTRPQTSPITGVTELQAATDSGGSLTAIDVRKGKYRYRFGTSAAGFDGDKTHTVGLYATRTFDGEQHVANATFDFLPAGGQVTAVRDIVTTEACNQCHNPLALHGGSRRETRVCVLCHSPQTVDPDTGNTVDFENMIHKIHRGAELPSVEAGDPYQIIGFRQSVHDFSTVIFPQPVQNCATCHSGSDGDRWMTPSRKACTSCHDRTSFVDPPPAGYTLHPGGDFSDDTECAVCHRPSGGLSGVADVHMTTFTDPARPDFVLAIDAVTNTAPGQAPIIDFTATVNGQGLDIGATPLNTLRVTVAGPTTDYDGYQQATIQGGGASGAPTPIDAAAGKFRYQLPAAASIPVGATGTFAFALEGYYQPAGGARVAAFNPIAFAPVTDASAKARRTVAYQAGCNSCHDEVEAHGGQRRNVEYCAMCHNPNTTGASRVARFEGSTATAEPVNLRVMIHKIHRGEDLSQPYVLGLYPPPSRENPGGTQHDFAHTRYPGDLRACWSCHPGGTTELPLATGLLPTRSEILTCLETAGDDEDDYCDDRESTDVFTLPTASVCGSCHDSPESAAHAEVMTSSSGVESCAACHGPGSVFDPAKSHRLDP